MFKKLNPSTVLTALILLPVLVQGQNKIGYVASDRIRAEYDEFKEAATQLQLEYEKVQFELNEKMKELDSLKQTFESQRLMSSSEWRTEQEQAIADLERRIQSFQLQKVGPEGELYKRQTQLELGLHSNIIKAVENVAIDGKYDFIFDSSISLLYGKPTFDVTDDVLHELRK